MTTKHYIFTAFIFISLSSFAQSIQDLAPGVEPAFFKPSANTEALWDIQANFDISTPNNGNVGQAGVIFFNNMFWTSEWEASDTIIRFSAAGAFIDKFVVPGLANTRSFTTDGVILYAGNNTSDIYRIDPATKLLLTPSTISLTANVTARYISYDPTLNSGAGGFWIGNFNTDIESVSMTGSLLSTISAANFPTNRYGIAVDNISIGGPFLWTFSQSGANNNQVTQFNLPSGSATGVTRDVLIDAIPGTTSGIAGGLNLTRDFVSGKISLVCLTQGAPANFITVYDIGASSPCAPININFSVSGLKQPLWAPASDPYTFYYGLVDAKRINANVSGGVGPYTYAWRNSGTPALLPRSYYPDNRIDLLQPTAATYVAVDVTDGGTGCVYSDSVLINWDDQYHCSTPQAVWSVVICDNGATQCVPWGTAKNLLKANTPGVSLGACLAPPKTDFTNQVLSFSIYPNPSSGLFTLEMPITANSKGSVEVMDVNGRALYSESIDMNEGVLYHTIDLSTLPNGIYIVRVASDNEFATERIQIIR